MYIPASFALLPDAREQVFDIVEANPFATLICASGGDLQAVHLPCLLDPARGPHGTLRAHVARANPIWRHFGTDEALAIFHGPHAYVSPDWYASPGLVPTWNYVAVHAYGVPRVIDDRQAVLSMLAALSRVHEETLSPKPVWTLDKVPEASLAAMLGSIVAFEIEVSRLEAKQKLSQNRSAADRGGVMRALNEQANEGGQAVARLMAEQESA
jgi:transcriptional regulator